MSTTELNPGNFTGINGVIVGRAGGPADFPRYDKAKSGDLREVRLAVDQGYKDKTTGEWKSQGTLWVSVVDKVEAFDALNIGKGDDVRVDDARISGREFERQNGAGKDWAFEARFGTLSVTRRAPGGQDNQDADF